MKKIYKNSLIIAMLLFSSLYVNAEMHMITVQNYAFTPNVLTVSVGDTIEWVWVNGSHTTTSSTIPAGALAWDQILNSTSQTFDYIVLVPGIYNYVCTFH